jgi:hypothetical protein
VNTSAKLSEAFAVKRGTLLTTWCLFCVELAVSAKLMAYQLKIFTWHIHGSYLYSTCRKEIIKFTSQPSPRGPRAITGVGETFPFGSNVIEIPAEEVKNHHFDCILFQTNQNFPEGSVRDPERPRNANYRRSTWSTILRGSIQQIPNTLLTIPDMALVHVTHFNRLMWDNGQTPTVTLLSTV